MHEERVPPHIMEGLEELPEVRPGVNHSELEEQSCALEFCRSCGFDFGTVVKKDVKGNEATFTIQCKRVTIDNSP